MLFWLYEMRIVIGSNYGVGIFRKLMEYNSFCFDFLETVRHPAASIFVGYIGPFHFDNGLLLKVFF